MRKEARRTGLDPGSRKGKDSGLAACVRGSRTSESVWSDSREFARSLLLGRRPDTAWKDSKGLARIGDWAYGLWRWGKPVMLRAALAAAQVALPVFEKAFPRDGRPRRRSARRVRSACRAALDAAREAARSEGFDYDLMPGTCPAYDAACAANQAAKMAHLVLTVRDPRGAVPVKLKFLPFNFVTSRAVRYAAGATSVRRVRAAVRKALLGSARR